jgi:hypothetical protein
LPVSIVPIRRAPQRTGAGELYGPPSQAAVHLVRVGTLRDGTCLPYQNGRTDRRAGRSHLSFDDSCRLGPLALAGRRRPSFKEGYRLLPRTHARGGANCFRETDTARPSRPCARDRAFPKLGNLVGQPPALTRGGAGVPNCDAAPFAHAGRRRLDHLGKVPR